MFQNAITSASFFIGIFCYCYYYYYYYYYCFTFLFSFSTYSLAVFFINFYSFQFYMLLIYNTIEKKERTINFGPQEQEILDQFTNFELHLQFKLGMPHSLLTCSS